MPQFSPVMASVKMFIPFHYIHHVVIFPDIFFISTRFHLLMGLQLDIACNIMFLQINEIFLAAVAAVCGNIFRVISERTVMLLVIKGVPFRLLPFGQPDECQISFTQFNNPIHSPDATHVCIDKDCIHHDRIIAFSSLR